MFGCKQPFTISFLLAVVLFMEQDISNQMYVNTELGRLDGCWDFLCVSNLSFSVCLCYLTLVISHFCVSQS